MDKETQHFMEFATFALDGKPMTVETRKWLRESVLDYVRGNTESLDKAMRLSEPGKPHMMGRLRGIHRNYCLREAYHLCDGDTTTAKLERLSTSINRFMAIVWPRWKNLDAPPNDNSRLHTALFNAAKTGLGVPESPRQLRREILEK